MFLCKNRNLPNFPYSIPPEIPKLVPASIQPKCMPSKPNSSLNQLLGLQAFLLGKPLKNEKFQCDPPALNWLLADHSPLCVV
jgi:hypothetical protein